MSTSVFGGRIRYLANTVGNSASPYDALSVRDVLHNNTAHAADQHAQVRVAWVAAPASISGNSGYCAITTPLAVGNYYPMWTSCAFPIAIRQVGERASYFLRIRIAGTSSDNTNSVTFSAVLKPAGDLSFRPALPQDYVFHASTSSSTVAWLSGASQGTGAYGNRVYLPNFELPSCLTETTTLTTVGGGPTTVQQAMVQLSVYGITTHVNASPRLYGVYAAEYVGT